MVINKLKHTHVMVSALMAHVTFSKHKGRDLRCGMLSRKQISSWNNVTFFNKWEM